MAEVTLEIAGRFYPLSCRDGEEEHLVKLGRIVDSKARDAVRAMGNMAENRQLLVAAILLADALTDRPAPAPAPAPMAGRDDPGVTLAIERLAERMENLAALLEKDVPAA